MNAQQLKNSVLQMAVQGKLVPQDPNDEPAKALLEKIKAEKAELVKQKKIKADKNPSHIFRGEDNLFYETIGTETKCIQDEIPFDIPDSWEWVRLKDIAYFPSTKLSQILQSEIKKEGKYPVISQSQNLIEGYSDNEKKLFKIKEPLILFGDHTRNVKFIDFDFIIGADGVKLLQPITVFPAYFFYIVLYNAIKICNRGYSRHFKFLSDCFFPLPPLEEQKRITQKLETLKTLCTELEREQGENV